MNGISLCAGYGGIELGLSLALGDAYRTVCCVEREAYAASVLVERMADKALHEAPVWDDIKTFDGKPYRGLVDIVFGGYPCQPFSHAGKRLGADDERHLWPDVLRIVREVQPRFCFFENVTGHLTMGFPEVRADLEEAGYRVEAGLYSAAEVGANHERKRLFILAYSSGVGQSTSRDYGVNDEAAGIGQADRAGGGSQIPPDVAYSDCAEHMQHYADCPCIGPDNADDYGLVCVEDATGIWGRPALVDPNNTGCGQQRGSQPDGPEQLPAECSGWWQSEPNVGRVAYGVASRVDRLRAIGNGVVPVVAAKAFICLAAKLAARINQDMKESLIDH